jgi:hypothetical protein
VEFATDEFLSEYYHFRTHLLRPSAKKLRRPPKTGFALTTVLLLAIGDAAEIRTKRVRKQKTDRQDAQLLLRLMLEDRFPRIWVSDAENRDLRQLLWHRHRLVQMRTPVMNQLQVVPLNEGLRRKKALWRPAGRKELESIALAPWASRRR